MPRKKIISHNMTDCLEAVGQRMLRQKNSQGSVGLQRRAPTVGVQIRFPGTGPTG